MTPYLAQYTIRSKQSYIFRTNRLREVTGASLLIAGAFDRLLSCAEGLGMKVQRVEASSPFRLSETLQAFQDRSLQVVDLFVGGGNDTLLMDSEETFRRLNEAYSYDLMVNTPGMIPLCAGVPMGENRDYREDYAALSAAASAIKSVMASGQPRNALPFAMLDTVTQQPFQPAYPDKATRAERCTAESLAKQDHYLKAKWWDETAGELDALLGKEDSMLAIVHADGNNMGRKLSALLGDNRDYDTCVQILRSFSQEIDSVFVTDGSEAVEEEKKRILEERKGMPSRFVEIRSMISDGDDYTFICNAKWALRLTRAYLQRVSAHKGYSACAGICLFHRHYPFARAYDIAEQACESAKKKVHTADAPDQCWIDFHYLHGGVPDDLEETRAGHGTAGCMFRPWRCDSAEDAASLDRLVRLGQEMISSSGEIGKSTRSNLKALGAAMEASESEAASELQRVLFRSPKLRDTLSELFPDQKSQLRAIYDLSEVYDLWFAKEGGQQHG